MDVNLMELTLKLLICLMLHSPTLSHTAQHFMMLQIFNMPNSVMLI